MEERIFEDRRDAGEELGEALARRGYGEEPTVVLGIPRGGVVVAFEVAEKFSAPLDVVIARKVRAPRQPELGIGAVIDGDHIPVLNEQLVQAVGASPDYLKREIEQQGREIDRQILTFRGDAAAVDLFGKSVIVVDDGIATGYTFRAALEGVRRRNPRKLIAAAPVAARESAEMVQRFADDLVCVVLPADFLAVGYWYRRFEQVEDEEVRLLLEQNWARHRVAVHG